MASQIILNSCNLNKLGAVAFRLVQTCTSCQRQSPSPICATLQILAIYDRFGRLLYGHPSSPVDVLEYVVFENYITDEYGRWRIHGKVAPAWARGFTAVAAPQKTRRLTSSPDPTTQ